MNKKIMILNGSPRPGGNTSALVSAFSKGAVDAGNTVKTFWLEGMNINSCKGCYCGGKSLTEPCVQNDDMSSIYPAYVEADVVVLASPLYFWTFSGQIRIAFDRLHAIAECDPNHISPVKSCALLMAAESHDFDEATNYYEGFMRYLFWKDLGRVLVGGVRDIGDIEGNPALGSAYDLGASIV